MVVLTGQPSTFLRSAEAARSSVSAKAQVRGSDSGSTAASCAGSPDELVAAYLNGAGTLELAELFGVHRATVHRLLTGAGLVRPQAKLSEAQIPEALRLRGEGRIYRQIAASG